MGRSNGTNVYKSLCTAKLLMLTLVFKDAILGFKPTLFFLYITLYE